MIFLFETILLVQSIFAFDCNLPNGCFIQPIKYDVKEYGYEKFSFVDDVKGIKCKVAKGYSFRFVENEYMANNSTWCTINNQSTSTFEMIVFEWPKNGEKTILEKSFNVTNMLKYLSKYYWFFDVYFIKLNGFEINLSDSIVETTGIKYLTCYECLMNFFSNGKLIKSCEDLSRSNSTIMSIFQMKLYDFENLWYFALENNEFPTDICPLVFENANISYLHVTELVDSFYKKNILRFTNDTFNHLNSTIIHLQLNKVENINLDLKILNPYVFKKLEVIYVFGSLKSIDKSIFIELEDLYEIRLDSAYFRKLVHGNGVDWINEMNKEYEQVDLRNITEISESKDIIKYINIYCFENLKEIPLFEVFPDEDFCIYKDFPFDRLVILAQYCETSKIIELINTEEFTCTYLWLVQYSEFYHDYYKYLFNTTTDDFDYLNTKKIIQSKSFIERSKCNFKHRLDLCNKTNYKIGNIWSTIDYYYLNKKLQIAFKIALYLISLFGILFNLLTVIIIAIKTNSDLFKGFKQYSYLCANSVFCLMILVINILSWTTECFYPFEVFCPEIRKLVFFQFFKIIFKECLTATFRFMMNFTYVAFALNRIAIIKKDQNKFLIFISEVSIYKYIGVNLAISFGLSVIKYFKYEVNYEYPFMNYPISNEWDIFNVDQKKSHTFDDAYFIVNSISDIINHVIFVLICLFIDIYMVRELRKVMADKLQRIERLYVESKTKIESAKKENDEAINKAIRMVVLNTLIGVLFKMPLSFIPILNVYADFYYKDFSTRYNHPSFGRFYTSLFLNGFYGQISDFADFLFILSISIQPLIYKNFDKKLQISFDRFFHKNNNQQQSNSSK